jgi:hypothetical protein
MAKEDIERWFANLSATGYRDTSEQDGSYNCFAWAAGDTDRWWSPIELNGYYWPPQISRDGSLDAYIRLYEIQCGYIPCESGDFEEGFEKIAIYVDSSNQVCHAGRQTTSGQWTHKLGELEDIEQTDPFVLEMDYEGTIRQFLKRPISSD